MVYIETAIGMFRHSFRLKKDEKQKEVFGLTRNLYGTYSARCDRRAGALYPYMTRRRRLGLDREQYRIYSGRGGRRADRFTLSACAHGAAALACIAFLLAGYGGAGLVVLTGAMLAAAIYCAVAAKRAQMARYARCGYYCNY